MSSQGCFTDFRFSVGPYELSCGRCDREAVQDVVQLLCGLWQNGVSSACLAPGSGRCTSYELRRLDGGAVDGGGSWRLLVSGGEGASPGEKTCAGLGVSGGLGSGPDGCVDRGSGRCARNDGVGHDAQEHGAESVSFGSSGRVAGAGSVRVGGVDGGGNANVDLGFSPRGPNYERNRLNRLRKKGVKEAAESSRRGSVGFFSSCDVGVQDELRETRAKLLVLQNKRRIVEEERKLAQLQSPMQYLADVVTELKRAEQYKKSGSGSGVAGWVAALSDGYAESLAKSAPVSMRSYESVVSEGLMKERKKKLDFSVVELQRVERMAVNMGVMTEAQVLAARLRCGRVLKGVDFVRSDFPHKISSAQREMLQREYF